MESTQTAAAAASAYHPAQNRRLTTYEQHAAENAATGTTPAFEKGDLPSFADLIDIINPLQHIPVINTIYRAITGDHEGAVADVIGGTLYGGPIGAAAAIADLGLRDATGKDAGEHVMAWMGFDAGTKSGGATAVASAKGAAPAQPAATVAAAAPSPQTGAVATATASATSKPLVVAMAGNQQPAAQAPKQVQAGPQIGTATSFQAGPMPPTAQPAMAANSDAGPVTMGDYLVFGGAAGAAAVAPVTQMPLSASQPQSVQGQAQSGTGPSFATIGANAQPAQMLPIASGPPASVQAPSSNVATMAAPRTAMSLQPRMFPAPPRTGPATPAANLPPPTTGPGALPGGKSQALSAQDIAMQNQNQSFLSAYTQALAKYQSAQRLGASNGSNPAPSGVAASGPLGGVPAAPPPPTSLIHPANDVTEGDTEDRPAVTVH